MNMNSTNNFQHHDQQEEHLHDHFLGCSPLINNHNLNQPSNSNSNSPLAFGVSTSLDWNSTLLSTTTSNGTYCNKLYDQNNHESSFQQSNNINFPKTEEDMLSSFPNFTTLLNNPTNIMQNSCSFNNFELNNSMQFPLSHQEQHNPSYRDHTPINSWINGHHNHPGYPSSNIFHQLGLVSSPNNSSTSISSCGPRLGLNMQAMDLLGTNNNSSFGSHVLHEEGFSHASKNIPSKGLAVTNAVSGTKRTAGSCTSDQSKASTSNNTTLPNKKSQAKLSCPPLKVRKEKLGDRIASLHQLVSPFGKTDTASVLTEAIGYIQFLQDQIQTLCMPHAKTSRNKQCKPFQMGAGNDEDENKDEESQIDIRERGLCLVPVSWTSYITPNQFDASNNTFF